jgi:transposase
MARIFVRLSESEQAIVASERFSHAELHVRRKMLVLWAVHMGRTRLQAAKVAGVGRATAQRYLAAYRDGGLEGLRRWGVVGPVSELAGHIDAIKASLSESPVRTIAGLTSSPSPA